MTKPPQITCRCHLRSYPHRLDQYCRELQEQKERDWPIGNSSNGMTSYERGVEERESDRERARYINAVNRGVAK